jgi:sulfur carrier protein ThiS
MSQQLSTFEVRSLALQLHELDPAQQLTAAEGKRVKRSEELLQLYLMRTSIEPRYTIAQQADALGVSPATIKRWAKSEEYEAVVAFMAPPTRSPMATEGKAYIIEELLPVALAEAKAMLTDPEVKPGTKATLFKEILRVALDKGDEVSAETQRRDAMAFLKEQGISAQNVQIIVNNNLVPDEYREGFAASLPDVVDVK